VLREAVSQTKYCCSPKVEVFGPHQKIFLGWLRHCPGVAMQTAAERQVSSS